jgi:hypothetical protein
MLASGEISNPDYYDSLDLEGPDEYFFPESQDPSPGHSHAWMAEAFARFWNQLPEYRRQFEAVSATLNETRTETISGWRGVSYANAHEACLEMAADLCDEVWSCVSFLPPRDSKGARPLIQKWDWIAQALERREAHIRKRIASLPDPQQIGPNLLAAARIERDQAIRNTRRDSPPPASASHRTDTEAQEANRQTNPGKSQLLSWTQADLDGAIRKYKAERASTYHELVEGVKKGLPGAKKDAQRLFGRNAIAEALRVKARAMVSKSPVWQEIAAELQLRPQDRGRRFDPGKRIGEAIAHEQEAEMKGDTTFDKVTRNETIRLIETHLPPDIAEATIHKLELGDITDDNARKIVDLTIEQRNDRA